MPITETINGIETVTTTQWSIATDTSYDTGDAQTTNGLFQVWLELNALASTDIYRFRVYEKVRSGGTQRVIYDSILTGVQARPFKTPNLMLMHGWDATIVKVSGTDRSIEWSIRKSPATIVELYNGIETVGTTEWSMTTDAAGPAADTTDGFFQFLVEVNAMASTDQFRFRTYEKVRSGGTQRMIEEVILTGAQPGPLIIPGHILMHGWEGTMVKLAGTDRSLEWSVRQIV